MSKPVEPAIKIVDRHKANGSLSMFAAGGGLCLKDLASLNRELYRITHPKLTARFHQRIPNPIVDLFGKQHLDAAGRRDLLIRSAHPCAEEPSGNHARIVQHKKIARAQLIREVRKHLILPIARAAAEQKHARIAALWGRFLRNQFLRQREIEFRNKHFMILVVGKVALRNRAQMLKPCLHCEPSQFFILA